MEEVFVSITGTELEDIFRNRDLVSVSDLFDKIIELKMDNNRLIEQLDQIEQVDVDPDFEYGISDRDFI